MNLNSYVKKFGKYSFKERPFNTVDACVLSTAVYSNFEVIAPSIHDKVTKETLFKDIFNFDMSVVTSGRILVRNNKKLIPLMRDSKRFGNIGIRYINKVFNQELSNQFYACTYLIPDVGTFVAFRGTDSSVIGWKEDLSTALNTVVLSQLDAVDYLDIISKLVKGPLYIGGHSKGGNLTLFASIYSEQKVKDRIVRAYSFDGNGLKHDTWYDDPAYLDIKDRITFIKPYDAIVSELMNNPKNPIVVKSKWFSVFQHDPYCWKINSNTGEFIVSKEKSKRSYVRHWSFQFWLQKISKEDIAASIKFFSDAMGGTGKTIFDYFFSVNKIATYIIAKNKLTHEERERVKYSIKAFRLSAKEAKLKFKHEFKKKR